MSASSQVLASSWALYQPIILGLGAVVLGTFGNGVLEAYKHALTNRRAADALRRALIAELAVWEESSAANAKAATNSAPGADLVIPVTEVHPIYEHNLDRLGLLSPAEVSAVVNAYAHLRAQIEILAIIGQLRRVEGLLQAYVPSRFEAALAAQSSELNGHIARAIHALKMGSSTAV